MTMPQDGLGQPNRGSTSGRIFWFGAHKVLKPTELRNLRELGFEVFNPPYITTTYDQSQDLRIDLDQPTTLPPEVFRELMAHDFFYTEVPPRIAELLNAYFAVAIITINPDWFRSFLRAFKGALIYRLYGQPYSLSEELVTRGTWELLVGRDDVSIVPFARESVEREQPWFLDRCVAFVPYQISDEVFDVSGTWSSDPARPEIATNIPNVQNPYYAAAYATFAAQFRQQVFRIYGPQRAHPPDPRIVGRLDRSEFLNRLAGASGYLYNYTDSVAYLAPIEMMEIGGPVIYRDGSLLSRLYGERTPGLIRDELDAESKVRQLGAGDPGLVSEILAAQDVVRSRYDRAVVRPLFDSAFRALLDPGPPKVGAMRFADRVVSVSSSDGGGTAAAPTVAVLLHAEGWFSHEPGNGATPRSRVAELARRAIETVVRETVHVALVTCIAEQVSVVQGLFFDDIKAGRIHLRTVPAGIDADGPRERLLAIEAINGSRRIGRVLVPSLTAFPEALLLTGRLTLLVSDEPLLPAHSRGPSERDADREVAAALVGKARDIIVTSHVAADQVARARDGQGHGAVSSIVRVLPESGAIAPDGETARQLAGRPFVLLEAEGCSDEQLGFALRAFALAGLVNSSLRLVCLHGPGQAPRVREIAEGHRIPEWLLTVCEADLQRRAWLIETAAIVWVAEAADGRSAIRVVDAVWADTPVVAVRADAIDREFGLLARDLALCAPSDLEGAAAHLGQALADPAGFRHRQRAAREMLVSEAAPDCLLLAMAEGSAPRLDRAETPPP